MRFKGGTLKAEFAIETLFQNHPVLKPPLHFSCINHSLEVGFVT
jgi:hypothetical protein